MSAELYHEILAIGKAGGAWERMLELEREAGNLPVFPGTVPWMPVEDWPHKIVMSITSSREVRIIAVVSLRPGSFSRLITAIAREGMTPVVIAPMGDTMPDIMRRWGWLPRRVGSGFCSEEQWRPTEKWLADRAAVEGGKT